MKSNGYVKTGSGWIPNAKAQNMPHGYVAALRLFTHG